ncbi:ATP synthase j chain domain-containing protein [Rhizoctonia solani AG-1 IA]|uniref:ATP synthase j chain domain-containing protein n=1 Tax=Thanatephorus cucumeris (strain AG1-IA) TaxID=983506 RepID=L8WVM8_THACA|nr:ATP synthase j chain domain-containing protein [Rhizoctonia solani AG-1 IA]
MTITSATRWELKLLNKKSFNALVLWVVSTEVIPTSIGHITPAWIYLRGATSTPILSHLGQTHLKSTIMSLFGFRKWPTPVSLIAKPLWPFGIATLVTYYLVSSAQEAGVRSEEHRNNPKNPYAAQIAAAKAHH